ncbi:hypothetical protein NFI96_012984 [Prochilodus magdalenae]|nr:hypothetical protein NFI96_012984 [Prochilodus magdalenae]
MPTHFISYLNERLTNLNGCHIQTRMLYPKLYSVVAQQVVHLHQYMLQSSLSATVCLFELQFCRHHL